MVEETAIRVQINAAKLAGQGIFGILQAIANMLQARQYGQQSIQSLNRQSQALASVELNDKTLPYVRRQLKEYSVDFAITKDKDTGQLNLWFKGQDVDRIVYLQNLYSGTVYALDVYESNQLAAVCTEADSGLYALLSARVVGDATERYQFECEQKELNTDDGASFHLTVTDTKNPDADLSTPSHDENTTVQRAAIARRCGAG